MSRKYRCNMCKALKDETDFHKNKRNTQRGLVYRCKDCQRASHVLRTYGLTWADYMRMYNELEGVCPLCNKWYDRLSVDHDHNTGKVRGLLCISCNRALGYVENRSWLGRALEYLG